MTVPVQIVHGSFSHKPIAGAHLRNGSLVTGRVLSRNGDGSYSVSIAGQRLSVKSEASLAPGSVFQARVKLQGSIVQLALVKESPPSDALVQKMPVGVGLSAEAGAFLSSLGFEPSMESLRIVQFMQQVGMKIDVAQAKKALLRVRQGGKASEERAQVSLLLEEKGIAPSDERVSAILGKNENEKRKKENREWKADNGTLGAKKENSLDFAQNGSGGSESLVISGDQQEPENLFSSVKDFFAQVDSAALTHEAGVLSAFNTVLSARVENAPLRHWIVLPFEWDFHGYGGTIRLLFDSELKKLEKLIIDLKNTEKNNIFVVYFKNGSVDSVRFATDAAGSEREAAAGVSLLASLFPPAVRVEQVTFDSLRGFCAGDEGLAFVRGVL